jgi:hypothetical protein
MHRISRPQNVEANSCAAALAPRRSLSASPFGKIALSLIANYSYIIHIFGKYCKLN